MRLFLSAPRHQRSPFLLCKLSLATHPVFCYIIIIKGTGPYIKHCKTRITKGIRYAQTANKE